MIFSVKKASLQLTSRRYLLSKAKEMGFKLRIHADEIESIGGVDVAAELGATSAEHLMMATDEAFARWQKLRLSAISYQQLPSVWWKIPVHQPQDVESWHGYYLTTDSNPGSCPTANLQFVMQLGCFMMRLTPVEVLNAVTINAAYSVNRQDKIGSFDLASRRTLLS